MLFGKKNKPKNVCVLLDSTTSRVLARGNMEGPPDGRNIQINIFEGNPLDVVNADNVQIIPADESQPPKLGHVIQRKGEMLVMEPLRELVGNEIRENLRMPVDFETYLYPTDGREGRWTARGNDLSCGGISFYTDAGFVPGEEIQVVIPITRTAPLLLDCRILRSRPETGETFYAAKFLELLNEQESMIREAVFNVQLRTMQKNRR
ncbi:PilZ domain-containing protein [Acutalibacter caecimuris]|uniref:PilZ domain-containing protein n=1 Tax=Acutalibacter caecimuris TaxID=3093657 RepID=UPI002AC9A007|nr:PilZ domain-containing protein [Acutalibacter sp. M00118]